MAKKKEPEGVPFFYQLFATLMILLLGFFVILNTLRTHDKVGGGKTGLGEVKDAFGVQSGFGVFSYSLFKVPRRLYTLAENTVKEGVHGVSEDLAGGEGGGQEAGRDPEDHSLGRYLVIKVPYSFENGSYEITDKLADYLDRAGVVLVEFTEYQIVIRSFSREADKAAANRKLATRRASAIMRYLNNARQVPYERMRATGYSSAQFFDFMQEEGEGEGETKKPPKQATFFYLFVKSDAKT